MSSIRSLSVDGNNRAMSADDSTLTITVTCGKVPPLQVQASPSDSGAALRRRVESELKFVDGGVRLLYKGRALTDGCSLSSAGVTSRSKLMALKTGCQHAHDRHLATQKQQEQTRNELNKKTTYSSSSSSVSPRPSVSTSMTHGDEEFPNMPYVTVQKGKNQYRVNVVDGMDTGRVDTLKVRLASFLPGVQARDIKLLCRGRVLDSQSVLGECGVRSGQTVMAMFNARHHDRMEACEQLEKARSELEQLEKTHAKVTRRIEHRLVPQDELVVVQAQVRRDVDRVRDNVEAVQGFADEKPMLLKRLDNLNTDFI